MTLEANGGSRLVPRDAADVAEILAGHSGAVEPLGAGTKRAIGAPIDADVLDLSGLAGIVDYEPAELVLTAQAATPLRDIQAALASHGQRLAFEPPDFGPLLGMTDAPSARGAVQTLGGVLAANVAGSRRVTAGAARDHFLGCSAVTGDGVAFKAGGKVVKNVTGYDLPKLLAGSWGTLAVMTAVTVRVVPRPETETTLIVPIHGVQDDAAGRAVAILERALASPNDVSAAAFEPSCGAALRIEGFEASVVARVAGVLEALGRPAAEVLEADASRRFWAAVGAVEALRAWPVVWRLSVPPADAPRVVAALAPEAYLLDWGGGLVWAAFTSLDPARVRGVLHQGHATLWKAPLAQRRSTPVFQPEPPAAAEAARRIKAAFDPLGRLSPGRFGVRFAAARAGVHS
jgi:glycolate oxidase FAD binding subunit